MSRRRLAAVVATMSVATMVVATACGSSPASITSDDTPGSLEGVGVLPEPFTADEAAAALPSSSASSTTEPRATVVRLTELGEVGDRAAGNRVIVIGDSITASTARRYGGEMCFALVAQGWAVEVNAEVGRFVDFGNRVLDRRLRPDAGVDWDAAVVFLGSNYGGDRERYRAELFSVLDRLAPRPTVLVTVSEFRPNRAEVNEVIRSMPDFYPELQVLDWATITAQEPGLLSGDRLHLSAEGRARLAVEVATMLGTARAPGDQDEPDAGAGESDEADVPMGECLSTSFTDDSAGSSRPGAVVPSTLVSPGNGAASTTATSSTTSSILAPTSTAPRPSGGGTTAPTAPPTSSAETSTTEVTVTPAPSEPEPSEPPPSTSPTTEPATTTSTTAPTTTAAPTSTAATTTTTTATTAAPPTSSEP